MLLRFIQHLRRVFSLSASDSALALCDDDCSTAAHSHKCPYAITETAAPLHTKCTTNSGCMPCNFSAQSDWRLSHRCKITGQRTAKRNTSPQTSSHSLRYLLWQRPCLSLRNALRSGWNVWLLAAVRVNFACKFQSIYNCLPIFKAAQLANRFPPTPTGENARGNCHAIWCSFVANVCDDFIFPLSDDCCTGFWTVCPTCHSAAMGIPEKYRRRLAVCWSGNYCSDAACSKYARITGTFAALLAFGGICVHLQIFTITGGRLSLCWMLSLRVLAGGLAAGFCWIGCQVFPNAVVSPEICSVSAPAVQYSRTTPIASLFLVEQHCSCYRQQQNNGRCVRKDNFNRLLHRLLNIQYKFHLLIFYNHLSSKKILLN